MVVGMDDQVTQPSEQTADSSGGDAMMLLRIEEMIKTHITQIDQLQEKITEHKEMLDDVFTNEPTYQEHEKAAKEAARIKSNTKQQILKRPDVANLAEKLKALKIEKSELQGGLSDYLREYQRLSGSREIEGEDGEIREIVYTAKLVKKNSQFRP